MANTSIHALEGFAALSDPTRRQIFDRLSRKALSVGELADGLPVTRPAVSQHLKVLKDAGLVVARAEGTRNIYRVDPKGVAAMRDYLDRFWQRALASFKEEVEKKENVQ
jgi:DNA-binding transcriptional ArsR family regulator